MDNNKHHAHQVTPLKVYYLVWAALVVGTIVTVASSYIDFGGSLNILIAMVIATVKAMLVILFFMGLKYDGQENNVTFFSSFAFLSIFVGLTASDIFYRTPLEPVKVDASELAQSAAPIDIKGLITPNPQLVEKG